MNYLKKGDCVKCTKSEYNTHNASVVSFHKATSALFVLPLPVPLQCVCVIVD